ncbi:hypothetical protein MMAN_58060 [Mycobacterium mantenii]|uniref:Uncharacterized protein n=1 Tax=Mycobacterium mantenii TaxID=560555 RepID=A0A1X0G3Y0_MYCNT|nr:hypothetical protein [Mycobacterium mantenii]MCV7243828.1 hypothetical protein [Mycobacterium mantenii]ORB08722.1 hypothetical protein BST30_01925 [Mycobacterium mantenii]BBY35890.1 hypothetical protein MMAN_00240 [Mycobacterium mantenii]BBY41672.1 hypothetical protein MMAN_58060 [Mycobacterium mantenii]
MPYRVMCHLVIAKDQEGRVRYYYQSPVVGSSGAVIPWLSDEKAEQLLRLGLVERIADSTMDHQADDAAQTESEALQDCLKALEHLGVDLAAGAPTARTALRDAGFRFGNDVVAAAVKARKDAVRALSGTTA